MITERLFERIKLGTIKHFDGRYAFPISLYLIAFSISFPIVWNNILIMLSFLIWLLLVKKDWGRFKNITLLFGSFLPFYLWCIFGISYSENINLALSSVLERKISFLIFPLIIFSTKDFLFSLKNVLYSFSLGFLLVGFISVSEILIKIYINNEPFSFLFTHYTRWNFIDSTSLSYHTLYMGLHAILAFIIILHYFKTYTLSRFFFKSSILSFLILLIYLLGVKSSFIFLLIVVLFYLVHSISSIKLSFGHKNLIFTIFLLFFSLLVYSNRNLLIRIIEENIQTTDLYWGSLPNRLLIFLKAGDKDRLDNWESAFCAFREQPILGVGAGDGLKSLQVCRDINSWNYINKANTHNQYLGIAVQQGLVGVSLFLVGFVFSFGIALKNNDKIYFIFLLIFVLSLFFENYLNRQKGIVLFTFLNSIFLCHLVLYDKFIKKKYTFKS